MAPQRKTKLPKPLPDGFILTDTEKKQWRLGERIGQGGFGLIYLASQDVSKPVAPDTNFVIKVEYHENGPLFSELKFYQRAAKSESMQKWKQTRKLDFLGIPTYWGSGLAEYNNLRYRFMAMDRLGSDLEKVCNHNGGQLKKSTVLQLGQVLVDVLEYIHENEYVHADIKAANLLLGYRDTEKIYLADYGLSYRYCPEGVHKEYKENPKKGHNGTIEYTSLDAHKGVAPSRRGDLQILGFCLLHWLCGSLPWDNFLQNPSQVQEVKARLMENLPDSVQQLSVSGASTDELTELLSYVRNLDYHDKPDYQYLKAILTNGVKGRLDFSIPQGHAGESATRVVDPHTKRKKVGQARGSSKVKPIVDENMQKEMKLNPVPAGPCPTRLPSHHQKEKGMSLPVRRSQRPKPVLNYKDNSEDEHDIDEQEAAKFCPIPAYHYRGPPIGPKAQSKQKTRSNKTTWRIDARPMTSEQRIHVQRRKHTVTDSDIRTQAHTSYREGWEESHQQWSDPKAREAGLTHWSDLWYSYFFIGAVLLFMGGLLAFKLLKDKINF